CRLGQSGSIGQIWRRQAGLHFLLAWRPRSDAFGVALLSSPPSIAHWAGLARSFYNRIRFRHDVCTCPLSICLGYVGAGSLHRYKATSGGQGMKHLNVNTTALHMSAAESTAFAIAPIAIAGTRAPTCV